MNLRGKMTLREWFINKIETDDEFAADVLDNVVSCRECPVETECNNSSVTCRYVMKRMLDVEIEE